MYEFDEESWDEQQAEAGYLGRPIAGVFSPWKPDHRGGYILTV